MKSIADFSDGFCFSGKVAITRASHEPITGTHCKNDFREIRSERNDAINCRGQINSSPRIISNLPTRTLIRSSSRSARRKQREADNNRYPP